MTKLGRSGPRSWADQGLERQSWADLGPARLVRFIVLVGLVVLVLHKVVEQARPGLVVVVHRQVVADGVAEIQKHVPSVPLNSANLRVVVQEPDPAAQDGGLPLREDELPEEDGHVRRQRLEADGLVAGEVAAFGGYDGSLGPGLQNLFPRR
jgi:hypothetical protein